MKLFIAGHSDSGSQFLAPGELPWPERTRAWLEAESGQPWELESIRFAPMGGRAVHYLTGAIERAAPDVVILPLGAYVCTVATVGESVKERFGPKAQSLFRRVEHIVDTGAEHAPATGSVKLAARKVARAAFGSRTLATVDEVGDIYEEVLHQLARLEYLQVVAIADARFSEQVQARQPKLHERIEQLYARIVPVAEQHHFVIADLEGALRRAPDRSVFYTPDGVHTTGAFHEVYFNVLQEVLPPVLARLGSAGAKVRPA